MCHARACHALSATSAAFGRPALVGPSVCSGNSRVCSGEDLLSYWNRMCFSGGRSRSIHPGFLEHTRISPEHTANRTRAYSRIARSTRLNVRHQGRRRVDFGARAGRRRSRSKLPAARFSSPHYDGNGHRGGPFAEKTGRAGQNFMSSAPLDPAIVGRFMSPHGLRMFTGAAGRPTASGPRRRPRRPGSPRSGRSSPR